MIVAEPKALSKDDVPQVSNPHTPIVLDGVNCRGTEANLESCGRESVVEYCTHHSNSAHDVDAGAFCTNIKGIIIIILLHMRKIFARSNDTYFVL